MKKRWQGPLPTKCQIGGEELGDYFIDGKTVDGPWAIMCPTHHEEVGIGLGTGRGQKYVFTHIGCGEPGDKVEG